MSTRGMWWASFGRAALGALVIIGSLAVVAWMLEIYFFAGILLLLTFLYRREILSPRRSAPLRVAPAAPGPSEADPPGPPAGGSRARPGPAGEASPGGASLR